MIPVRGFEGKTVAVFGLGRTGLSAARALIAGGAKVALWDEKPASREAAAAEGLNVVDLSTSDWSDYAALMLSPGVPLTHPKPHWTVTKAKAAGVEVLGDIELFARTVNAAPEHKKPKIIAITGTNGKSTTTALIGDLCRQAGRDTRVGGNIGEGVLGLGSRGCGEIGTALATQRPAAHVVQQGLMDAHDCVGCDPRFDVVGCGVGLFGNERGE